MKTRIIGLAMLSILNSSALAETKTVNFQSSATVNSTCEITSTPDISFGELAPNPSVPGEIGVLLGQHMFPIIYKCSPHTVVTVTYAVGTPENPGDDPYTNVVRGQGVYGVLTGQRTGVKLTYRLLMMNYAKSSSYDPTHTITFGEDSIMTELIGTALREFQLPPPDTYADTARVSLSF